MDMVIEGNKYKLQFASDIDREGLGLECYRHTDSIDELVLEVFRNDAEHRYLYTQWAPELPLSLVEHIVRVARIELGDFVS